MSEQVADSWEDLDVLDDTLDKKLNEKMQQMKVTCSRDPNGRHDNSSISMSKQRISNDNNSVLSGFQILKRPTGERDQQSQSPSSASQTKHCDSNNVLSTPCTPQITLEDNTRTAYVPQLKILKRPDAEKTLNKNINSSNESNGSNRNHGKSLSERQAEYEKARIRILGSATPLEEENNGDNFCGTDGSLNHSENPTPLALANQPTGRPVIVSNETEVPVIRQPQGPDHSKGFKGKR